MPVTMRSIPWDRVKRSNHLRRVAVFDQYRGLLDSVADLILQCRTYAKLCHRNSIGRRSPRRRNPSVIRKIDFIELLEDM